jgi:serine/threonine-protein phosphatase 6 regulatory ankyrin repeat subunit A
MNAVSLLARLSTAIKALNCNFTEYKDFFRGVYEKRSLLEAKSWKEIGIILSSFQGSEQCLELLIGHFGPSIVILRDHRGRTPLHVAAFHNNVDCMQLLLSHGASVEARDVTGKTPLLQAACSGQCNAIGENADGRGWAQYMRLL